MVAKPTTRKAAVRAAHLALERSSKECGVAHMIKYADVAAKQTVAMLEALGLLTFDEEERKG